MPEATIDLLRDVVSRFFTVPVSAIGPETSAADVDGWDSVSQATLIFAIEDEVGVTLDFKETLDCRNLLDLSRLIDRHRKVSQANLQKKPIVAFGNCQVESLVACMTHHSSIVSDYTMHFVQSYTIGGDEQKTSISEDILSSCSLFFEQMTPFVSFKQRDKLPKDCKIITFPSLDFNLLWPLHAAEPRNRPEPDFPFGRFAYGDRVINWVVGNGWTGEAAWDAYQARSAQALRDLPRLAAIERQRWDNLDSGSSLRMSDEIFSHFRRERLFYNYNHPTSELLCRLGVGLLLAADFVGAGDRDKALDELRRLFTWDFGADYAVPIHPSVAEAFELEWWTPDLEYRKGAELMTYEQWIRKQIAWQ